MLYKIPYMKEFSTNKLSLMDQVCADLNAHIGKFKSVKIGVRLISEKIGVSERTLYRLLAKENKPTYQTLYKIYREIHQTNNESLLIELVPQVIRDEIEKINPNKTTLNITYHKDIESEIYYDRTFAEIYFLAACAPITNELIQFRYGMSGMMTLERMVEMKALTRLENSTYTLGENQANFSAKTLKRVGLSLIEKYSKPSMAEEFGNNIIAFYAEGLSDEAYDEWLKIDKNAFEEKIKISNQKGALGTKRAFTFMVTDTLQEK